MNPKSFGKLANHRQEKWKLPLPQFIEELYFKRFGRTQPDQVTSIEQVAEAIHRKNEEKKQIRQQKRALESLAKSTNENDTANEGHPKPQADLACD